MLVPNANVSNEFCFADFFFFSFLFRKHDVIEKYGNRF